MSTFVEMDTVCAVGGANETGHLDQHVNADEVAKLLNAWAEDAAWVKR